MGRAAPKPGKAQGFYWAEPGKASGFYGAEPGKASGFYIRAEPGKATGFYGRSREKCRVSTGGAGKSVGFLLGGAHGAKPGETAVPNVTRRARRALGGTRGRGALEGDGSSDSGDERAPQVARSGDERAPQVAAQVSAVAAQVARAVQEVSQARARAAACMGCAGRTIPRAHSHWQRFAETNPANGPPLPRRRKFPPRGGKEPGESEARNGGGRSRHAGRLASRRRGRSRRGRGR